jgi:hypothetical protein
MEKAKSYQDNAIFALDPNNSPIDKYEGVTNKITWNRKWTTNSEIAKVSVWMPGFARQQRKSGAHTW